MSAGTERTENILKAVLTWVKAQDRIHAAALVGSWAHGLATPNSDIDLLLLTVDPNQFRADLYWMEAIDWKPTGARPSTWYDAQYGNVWSRHVVLNDGLEVEFAFAAASWATCSPLDNGTRRVVSSGCRILYDPDGLLAAVTRYISGTAPQIG